MATALTCSKNLGAATAATSAEPAGAQARTEGNLWVAHNEAMEIAVNTNSGVIERLVDRVTGEDYCHQKVGEGACDIHGEDPCREGERQWPEGIDARYKLGARIGGLLLVDELRNKVFYDLTDPGQAGVQHSDASTLSFDKTYPGAEFVVTETFKVQPDHIRWDVSVKKTKGADRNVRVVQFLPLPLRDYEAWAPIAETPFRVDPYWPFAIQYGQSTMGAVGEEAWRTCIPMMVFFSEAKNRALCVTSPIEVPTVRLRFLSNTGAEADFHWNSRTYPPMQRPYFQVSHEYLSVRDGKDLEAGLLISAHPADWRPALGWVYSQYRSYFDADPSFYEWDGVYGSGRPYLLNSLTREDLQKDFAALHQLGERWEELHGHFPWYGLMIPPADVKTWTCHSHPASDTTLSRQKIEEHCQLTRQNGIGTFLYYNVTESEHEYAQKEFAASIAHGESGEPVGAWRAQLYPSPRACFLMNADPASDFGRHMIQQARDMVAAYPDAAGFFWDVYGRSYMFDFSHDDGITMVNNKPVYYPEFMYQRLMREHIRPLLRSSKMLITANKPVTIASCEGVDGVMAYESAPDVETPAWIAAQSFLGLNRHVMIISRSRAHDPEMGFLQCLRYGMFYSYNGPFPGENEENENSAEEFRKTAALAKKYGPFIELLRGKQWIFHPRALELPEYTDGNIFRLRDGGAMVTMVSAWRQLRKVSGFAEKQDVVCRLPDADKVKSARATAIDLDESWDVPLARNGDTLTFTVPRHGKATAIVLSVNS